MLEIAQPLRFAQRPAEDAQVGDVDQAQLTLRREHHIAHVRRAEVHPALMQNRDEPAQLRTQLVVIGRLLKHLAQGLPRQWRIVHGIALDCANTVYRLHHWTRNLPLLQVPTVVGKALRIRIPRSRAEQALATKQFEHAAIGQAQDLVAGAVGFEHSGAFAQCEITCLFKRLHQVSRVWPRAGQPPILPAAGGRQHRVWYNPDSFSPDGLS